MDVGGAPVCQVIFSSQTLHPSPHIHHTDSYVPQERTKYPQHPCEDGSASSSPHGSADDTFKPMGAPTDRSLEEAWLSLNPLQDAEDLRATAINAHCEVPQ